MSQTDLAYVWNVPSGLAGVKHCDRQLYVNAGTVSRRVAFDVTAAVAPEDNISAFSSVACTAYGDGSPTPLAIAAVDFYRRRGIVEVSGTAVAGVTYRVTCSATMASGDVVRCVGFIRCEA